MAYFAKINNDKIVETVIVTDQDYINRLKNSSNWIETSYTGDFRKNYAGIGYTYDTERDAFIAPKPMPSSKFIEETCTWEMHTPYPEGKEPYLYEWDEATTSWIIVND